MRGLTLTWTPIILILVILLTSSFPDQAQARDRTITKSQIEELIKNLPNPPTGSESMEKKLERLFKCTQGAGRCSGIDGIRSMVINELLLRRQIREMGADCTSDGNYSTALYSSAYRGHGETVWPGDAAYETWQDELLDTGLTFCNPFKHLSCSSISKKCECRPGTVWKPEEDKCSSTILGGYCWPPGELRRSYAGVVALYNPITSSFHGAQLILDTFCPEEFKCGVGLHFFLDDVCVNNTLLKLDQNLQTQFEDLNLPPLKFGETCNLEHETQLYTTTDAEVNDYKIRIKIVETILAAKTPFCDQKLLLTCGSGGKCECIKPTTYNPATKLCTFKYPHGACQAKSTFEKLAAKFARVGKDVTDVFEAALEKECPSECVQTHYPGGRLVVPVSSFCPLCPGDPNSGGRTTVVGKKCDKALTRFLEGAPPPSLPIDIPDYDKQLELFVQFNEKAKEFEKLFRLQEDSPCAYVDEIEVYRTIRGIKSVERLDKVFTELNYKDVMSAMNKIIAKFRGNGLCLYRLRGVSRPSEAAPLNRPFLLCGPTPDNSICYNPNNTVYFEELMKRLSVKSFQATPTSGPCTPHPKDIFKYAETEFGTFIRRDGDPPELETKGFEYVFNTLENHWIDNSQFCNRTGGFKCTKSVDDKSNATGKCEFSKDLLEKVQAELEAERLAKLGVNATSKSSHHSIQHFWPTLLLILHINILI